MEGTRLIIGLGNPGKAYENTRHNIGFRIVKAFAAKHGISLKPSLLRAKGSVGKGKVGDHEVLLLMPLTYMNESGLSVRKSVDYYQIPLSHLLVVADDIYLPFGQLRLRMKGAPGGHNGLKSVEAHLGTEEYPRLKIGIGDREQGTLSDHVLENFTEEEEKALPEIVDKAINVIENWLLKLGEN